MELRDRHVLITGGTSGIGLALAEAMLVEGARVTVCGRNSTRLEKTQALLGPAVCVRRCDITDVEEHRGLLDFAHAAHGPLHVLVHNAGVQESTDFLALTRTNVANEVATNLVAPIQLSELALPSLLEQEQAAIVYVTSALALSPKASAPVYCASKAGLRSFARTLRWQLEATSVRVMEVLPPLVETAMTAGRAGRQVGPEVVASKIIRGLRRDMDEVFIGKARLLRWLMWLSPWLTGRLTRKM